MSQHFRFDASRSLTALEQDNTIIAVIEMSQTKWLVAALVPGVERQPLKKFDAHEETLLKLLHRWRREAGQAGRNIKRIVVAFEAGRDGFWLARWLRAHDVEVYVIHPTSISVSREHRRAKTDRLDTELLMRVFLGWLRGETRHCSMVAIPTIEEEEDARRPNRERQTLVTEQTRIINQIKAIFTRLGIRSLRPTMRKRARLGSSGASEGQRTDRVVLQANFRCPRRHAQDDDRGARAQAPHCAVAARDNRREAGRSAAAPGRVRPTELLRPSLMSMPSCS
jgi:transposase